MPQKGEPTLRRWQLGQTLKARREALGLSHEQAVVGTNIQRTTLPRVEGGTNSFRRISDLEDLMTKLQINDPDERETMRELHRHAMSKDWFSPYRSVMALGMPNYVGLESAATTMRAYHPSMIYGLLQHESYMRTLLEDARKPSGLGDNYVEEGVKLRLGRQDVLTREEDPLRLQVVMDEGVLRKVVGSAETMIKQYRRLIELSELGNVQVQVAPADWVTFMQAEAFVLLGFGDDVPIGTIASLDGPMNAVSTTDKTSTVDYFSKAFDLLKAGAMPVQNTIPFIERLMKEVK